MRTNEVTVNACTSEAGISASFSATGRTGSASRSSRQRRLRPTTRPYKDRHAGGPSIEASRLRRSLTVSDRCRKLTPRTDGDRRPIVTTIDTSRARSNQRSSLFLQFDQYRGGPCCVGPQSRTGNSFNVRVKGWEAGIAPERYPPIHARIRGERVTSDVQHSPDSRR